MRELPTPARAMTYLFPHEGCIVGPGTGERRNRAAFHHMDEQGEALDAVRGLGEWLAHVHLAYTGRMNPGTGAYDYPTLFAHLKASGYSGVLSAECGFLGEPVAEMRSSGGFLRRAWADAKD